MRGGNVRHNKQKNKAVFRRMIFGSDFVENPVNLPVFNLGVGYQVLTKIRKLMSLHKAFDWRKGCTIYDFE